MRLKSHLLQLVLAGLLPVVLFATATGVLLVGEQRSTFRRGAEERALAMLSAVDAQLSRAVDAIQVLGLSESLRRGDIATFRGTAQRVLATQPDWITITVAAPGGERIMDLLVPPGEPLPTIPRLEDSFSRVLQARGPVIGNLAEGMASAGWSYAVRTVVMRGDALEYVLTAIIRPDAMARLVLAQNMPQGWVGVVLDANGRIVARTVDPEISRGQLASPSLRDALTRAPNDWFRWTTDTGVDIYTAYQQSAATGWTFGLGVPASDVVTSEARAYTLFGIGLLTALALAFVLTRVVSSRVTGPIAALAAFTERVRRGERTSVPQDFGVTEIADFARTLGHTLGALREREQRLELALSAGRMGLWEWNPETNESAWSAEMHAMHGFSGRADADNFDDYLNTIHPDDREAVKQAVAHSLEHGSHNVEYRIIRADGEVRWLEGRGKLFREEAGKPGRLIGLCADITERKRFEEELKASEQALREADRHKDEFLATLSHELRNPLAALTTAAHVLRATAPADERTAAVHGVIERQTQHITRLIEDLLDMTRVRLGKLSLYRERMNLAALVADVTQARRSAGDFTARADVALDVSEAWIDGDTARMEQVFGNLLDNALKFTPATGHVRVTVKRDGDAALLEVSDDGQGIAPETLPRIFELFVQGDDAPRRTKGGLGLGLALVRRLVQLHGGDVTASSAGEGHGTTISVRLPAVAAPAATGAPEAAGSAAQRVCCRVLLVEDNDDVRQMTREVLELEGHVVYEAATGAHGLALATQLAPDAVLLDIGLPDIDGYDIARRLRATAGPGLVLIALSGHAEDSSRARAAGFNAHIIKPAGVDQVVRLLDELVQRERGAAT